MAKESRRKFLKTVPVAMAGAAVAGKAFAQGQGQAPAGPITAATIDCAEVIPGLDFHKDEEAAMVSGLNRQLNVYKQLRGVAIGPEIDPGVPALYARRSGLALALKSGNFGAPAFFDNALAMLAKGSDGKH